MQAGSRSGRVALAIPEINSLPVFHVCRCSSPAVPYVIYRQRGGEDGGIDEQRHLTGDIPSGRRRESVIRRRGTEGSPSKDRKKRARIVAGRDGDGKRASALLSAHPIA